MAERKLILILGLSSILFFSALFVASLVFLSNKNLTLIQPDYSNRQEITAVGSSESFRYPEDSLYLVYLRLDNSGNKNTSPFVFSISDGSRNLVELPISGKNIPENDWVKFQFPQINNLKNKEIYIKLYLEDSNDPIYLRTDTSGRMGLKMYSRGDFFDTTFIQLQNFFQRFLNDLNFFVFFLITILITIGGLIWPKVTNK